MRIACVLSLALACVVGGCLVPPPAVTAPAVAAPAAPVAAPAPDPMASFGGAYALVGRPMADGCGGQVYLAARSFVVDPAARTLFADVVNRTYSARIENGALVAEGYFEHESLCQDSRLFERWTLTRQADGSLAGTLESIWPLPPACSPCGIQFAIVAIPGS
jgi:hypothetical protein